MENKMESEIRNSIDLTKRHIKKQFNEFTPINRKTNGNDVIKEYLFQKDVAAWFRGTSHYHIKGADKLFNALRDDGEQETTHRVRTCLNLIGLSPMITSKQIKFLMYLSRGNDLVFLWFLMEKHYRTPKVEFCSYSQNEQLICSAICHLDMVTTLRELDRILPSGYMKKKSLDRHDLKESLAKRKNKTSAHQFVLPYFTKYNQPQHYGKCLFLEQPNFRVNFKHYNHFSNPNYTVQNEANRWYENYQFNPDKRIVHSILYEIIKSIFYNFEIDTLKTKSSDILCSYHRTLKLRKTILKHELLVKARDDCLKCCLTEKQKEYKHANNIKTGLGDSVQQMQLFIFSNQTETASKNYTLKTITSDCKVHDIILGGNGDCNINTEHCETFTKNKIYSNIEKNIPYADQRNKQRKDELMTHSDKFQQIEQNIMHKWNTSFGSNKERFNENSSYDVNETISRNDAFFKRPFMHQPYKFNYKKIFANYKLLSKESDIRKIIMKTLNENISNLSTENKDSQLFLYDDVVEKFIETAFEQEIKRYKATNTAQSSSPLSKNLYSGHLNFENYNLMEQILFEAFQHLRKNPKFVWAQLPDAHKVPFLREWIVHRFGKEYTPIQRTKSFQRSCLIFRALETSNMKSSVPNGNKIGKNLFVDYNCRKHVERKVQQLKRKYYQSLNSHLLEHTRIFWFAMRGYICSNGPPRKSFYAYMPSRFQDIQHSALWKSTEFRNNWNAWNIRRNKRV